MASEIIVFDLNGTLAQAALQILAAKESVELSSADEKAVANQMSELPAFAEVPAALGQLRAAGFRLVALTNGACSSVKTQLEHAGIANAFEAVFPRTMSSASSPRRSPTFMWPNNSTPNPANCC